jgi:hypothetical protein
MQNLITMNKNVDIKYVLFIAKLYLLSGCVDIYVMLNLVSCHL